MEGKTFLSARYAQTAALQMGGRGAVTDFRCSSCPPESTTTEKNARFVSEKTITAFDRRILMAKELDIDTDIEEAA